MALKGAGRFEELRCAWLTDAQIQFSDHSGEQSRLCIFIVVIPDISYSYAYQYNDFSRFQNNVVQPYSVQLQTKRHIRLSLCISIIDTSEIFDGS